MTIEKKPFGETKDGKVVELYALKDGGMIVEIITLGAIIRSVQVPVRDTLRDVALGFDTVEGYEANKGYHGAVIGRISNRVAKACYKMDGKTYKLDANDGANSLHGGFVGFDKQVWTAKEEQSALVLTLVDKEGTAAGYPGDLEVTVKYTLSGGELGIEYTATCTKDTPINLTNHVYFNLAGHDAGDVGNHKMQIFSHKITPVDETLIPTGELMDVTDTAFDLRELTVIAPGLSSDCPQINLGGGYDHNWVLSNEAYRPLTPAAATECDGLSMTCATTKPGIQFYSGNMMQGETGKGGAVYSKRTGLCLETQYWPNSVNTVQFPAPLLKKGETYNHKTTYLFREV
ncbi:MAG: galactose mutarotase [Oscillospiraceae bacterium]|nr:galactose mutarotase [Oscillospiraceae bacterium]MCL2279832.1 galactose mutarotase [Oscillospiraceae bacterium]